MELEQKIMSKIYLKTIFCAVALTGVGITAVCMTDLKSWPFVILPGVWGAWTYSSFKKASDAGDIVSVYAMCIGHEGKKLRLGVNQQKQDRKSTTHRFVVATVDSEFKHAVFNEAHNIYIVAGEQRFREGEMYCLLFHKRDDGAFNETNLVGSAPVPPNVTCFNINENDAETAETLSDNAVHIVEIPKKENHEKPVLGKKRGEVIYFPGTPQNGR